MNIRKIFDNLKGVWKFQRNVRNKADNSPIGIMNGTATLDLIGNNQLHYKEEGELSLIGQAMVQARKEYLYLYLEQEDRIEKHFSQDGNDTGYMYTLQFRKSLEPNTIHAIGNHLCKNDNYDASYEFEEKSDGSCNRYKLTYIVIGPEKDYIAETIHERTQHRVIPNL